jgi:RHS repeat-associated protein
VRPRFTGNLRYAGQYYDSETGLCNNWHRYYDSKIGRYLRVDPIGLEGGINLYSYTFNSPVSFIDFNGLQSVEPCPLTKCPGGCCEISIEDDVSRPLNQPFTDREKIIDYYIKNGILTVAVLIEEGAKHYYKVKIPRPLIPVTLPKNLVMTGEIYARFDCIVEVCPATMDRKELCSKRKGTEYKVITKEYKRGSGRSNLL